MMSKYQQAWAIGGPILAVGLFTLNACGQVAFAQQPAGGELEVLQLQPSIYMIAGAGGNIAAQIGEDGVILVGAGSGKMPEKVVAAIGKLTKQPIRIVIDPNADPDNVGGNAFISKAGRSFVSPNNAFNALFTTGFAPIWAHENVLNRMSAPTGKQSPYSTEMWPTVTHIEKQKVAYFNGEGIQILYKPAAHTDGDLVVFFRRSDVIVAGDIFDATRFPVIDLERGGSIQGELDAVNSIVALAIPQGPLSWREGGTQIIPGRGRISEQADILDYRDMLTIIRDRIQDLIKKGKTLQQIQQANPTEGFRRRYGTDSGSWTTDMFVEAIYKSLTVTK